MAVGLSLTFLFSPLALSADALSDLQAQVKALLEQVTKLQAQLSQLQNGGSTGSTTEKFCHTFNTNLRIGDHGAEVDALQTALFMDLGSGVVPGDADFFDEALASAVVGFQEKYASEILTPNGLSRGSGFIGASTRATAVGSSIRIASFYR